MKEKQLVILWERPSYDGSSFTYYTIYTDENGKRRQKSLGHSDARKAERQRAQLERELRMGLVEPGSMKLSVFIEDSLHRTGNQIRQSTATEYRSAMQDFINIIGDKDFKRVSLSDGELYRQKCLDKGNSPATVKKKLTEIKAVFQLAVKRQQIDQNPFRYISMPRCPQPEINVYSDTECERILKAAQDVTSESDLRSAVRWDLLVVVALSTGLRRGELLNCTWANVDFEAQTIRVEPKDDIAETWLWLIKDTDRRTLPLTGGLVQLLVDLQSQQPEGYPYVFVPPARYDRIQQHRDNGNWTYSDSRLKVIINFDRNFKRVLKRATVKPSQFHDLRRTAICNWFAEGMSEFEVMKLAGHANFSTTHKYYLAVADDLIDKARRVNERGLCQNLLQKCCSSVLEKSMKKADNCKQLPAKEL